MAFLHRAWTFQPIQVHEEIAARVVVGQDVDARRLLDLAREVAGLPELSEYLQMIRYDQSWLDEAELGEAHLYVTAMGAHLDPAGNIRWPGLLVHYLRERLHWADEEAWQLLRGEPLATLPIDDVLMSTIQDDLARQFGGWLSNDSSAVLLERLRGVREHFLDPEPAGLAWVSGWSGENEDDARRALAETHEDACAVLDVLDGLPPGFALRCIAD